MNPDQMPRNAARDEAPEWDGEGLPPVGSEFEFSASEGKLWEERVMLFNDGITCLMAHRQYPTNRWHYKCEDPDIRFRPIRSEEDRAVEDMVKTMNSVVPRDGDRRPVEDVALALYRAGYRKEER